MTFSVREVCIRMWPLSCTHAGEESTLLTCMAHWVREVCICMCEPHVPEVNEPHAPTTYRAILALIERNPPLRGGFLFTMFLIRRGGFLFTMFLIKNSLWSKEPPASGGVSYLLCSWSRTGRQRTPPEEPPPKLINFGGGSSGGVLFLPVLDQEHSKYETPPEGGGSFDQLRRRTRQGTHNRFCWVRDIYMTYSVRELCIHITRFVLSTLLKGMAIWVRELCIHWVRELCTVRCLHVWLIGFVLFRWPEQSVY